MKLNGESPKIGVYICECGINISATVNVEKVVEYARTLPNVTVSRYYKYMCSDPGQALIKKDIKELGVDRVVVASCSPRMHEPTFRAVLEDAGLNPYCFEMANIREHCSWAHAHEKEKATEKAKDLVRMAVAKAKLLRPLEKKEVPVIRTALVIGGGISGIQAALEVANKGIKTYLVERSPSIGGRMAQLDKTFPTLDCSACILTPKMVDVARHPDIELLTYSIVEKVDGYIGNFKVTVRKKARYVDIDKCVGCGRCAEACRLKGRVDDEFNENLGKRSAIYVPFPQAVPLKYTIDPNKCIYLKTGKCGEFPPCKKACEANAINHEQKDEVVELDVGTIIVATGYDLFDPTEKPEYGYGKSNRVITGLEFERLVSSSGPTGGHIEIDGKEPKKVVFIQCVGSRDRKGNEYCSRVCCMYTAKHAHLVREKVRGAELTVYYTDVRAFGKGFEEFYNRVKDEGISYMRRELDDPIEVVEKDGKVVVKADGHPDIEADLVVLATAIIQRKDIGGLAKVLRISQGADRFFLEVHPKLRPMDTATRGIFLAGCCQGPKDIPDTVAQASGAAARAAIPILHGKIDLDPQTSEVIDKNCDGCAYCIDPCPYKALTLIEYMRDGAIKKTVEANEALCQGCGVCQATCPKQGIIVRGFTLEQISAMVQALLGVT
ncbi:MAG: CoB--CoM heterodisulfide reductase iron-sulfur subunit A family protein [Euryarchaeota archaeon]|nr:CoB--CoM heterodisulfide reductase iron-sulfur subunit A family protein [Euryarchaeota archaeon]